MRFAERLGHPPRIRDRRTLGTQIDRDATGKPLREGFADFFQVWVGFPSRNVAEGVTTSATDMTNISNVRGRWNAGFDIESKKEKMGQVFSEDCCHISSVFVK